MVCVCMCVHACVCMMHVVFSPDTDKAVTKINLGKV